MHGCVRLKNFVNLHALYDTARKGHVPGCNSEAVAAAADAELIICNIHDSLCSAQALDPEPDCSKNERDAAVYPDIHPCRCPQQQQHPQQQNLKSLINMIAVFEHQDKRKKPGFLTC